MRPIEASLVAEGVSPGTDVLGAYHLLRPIARGGMASVWLAVDARSGRAVVVKRMLAEVAHDLELRRAFTDEATLGLSLSHPNLIETLEFGDATTALGVERYLVLELLHGRSLMDLMKAAAAQRVAVPIDVAMSIVRDAARGLHHVHQLADADGPLGVVHRDVSPHNVFVCLNGVAKLLDFGIAKAKVQSHRTETGAIKGKLAYLAPEQIRGRAPDARLDIFSLGVVMYELLTGQQLFHGNNDAETLYRILDQEIAPPETVRPEVPPGIGAIVLRALQRDPERRLPSAEALADTIEAVAQQEGIVLDAAVTGEYLASLFPDDERRHAEHLRSAERLYLHLNATDEPALVVPAPAPALAPTPHRLRRTHPLLRAALTVCVLSLAAFAAASAAGLLRHHSDEASTRSTEAATTPVPRPAATPRLPESPAAPRRFGATAHELPDPSALERAPTAPRSSATKPGRHGSKLPTGCAVYYSITKGGPTVVCEPRLGRGSGSRGAHRD